MLRGRISCLSTAGGRQRRALVDLPFLVDPVTVPGCSHAASLSFSPFQVGCLAELRSPASPADCCHTGCMVCGVGGTQDSFPSARYVLALTCWPGRAGPSCSSMSPALPASLQTSFGVRR